MGHESAQPTPHQSTPVNQPAHTHPPPGSVQYLQQPEAVFAEVYRVLKPGGVAIFTFSNRMFYDKAINAWRDGTGYGRWQLVKQ